MSEPETLYDKVFNRHVVQSFDDGSALFYIDRHLIHEVTSPQAFTNLQAEGRRPWRVDCALAVPDHNVPTTIDRLTHIADPFSKSQLDTLKKNCNDFKVPYIDLMDKRQGIVHIIGPEQGMILPGTSVVCGDSHTATHGAFGAIAMGIGTSEVEHVLATQCLRVKKMKNFKVHFEGALPPYLSAKDMILALIRAISTAGGTGYCLEFTGQAVSQMSMSARMTLCNMAIEAGARCGLIAPDETTYAYLKGRPFAPSEEHWAEAVSYWQTLQSDEGAVFDRSVTINITNLKPQVSWGTSPEMVIGVDELIPNPVDCVTHANRSTYEKALTYMGLKPGIPLSSVALDKVFIGSCTNARIEDLREAAQVVKGKHIASCIKLAMVVPGSGLVKEQAEAEGLDLIFMAAGFQWREPGCSMCIAMNPDKLEPGERCASTSNRNFEGRQGTGGRTHLASPRMVASAAIHGHFVDVTQESNT